MTSDITCLIHFYNASRNGPQERKKERPTKIQTDKVDKIEQGDMGIHRPMTRNQEFARKLQHQDPENNNLDETLLNLIFMKHKMEWVTMSK